MRLLKTTPIVFAILLTFLSSCNETDLVSPSKLVINGKKPDSNGQLTLVPNDIQGLSQSIGFAGDVIGTGNATSVVALVGTPLSPSAPTTTGQVLTFNGTNWIPQLPTVPPATTAVTMSGDITSASNTSVIDRIKGYLLTLTSLSSGDFIMFNGTGFVNSKPVAYRFAGEIINFAGNTCPTGTYDTNGDIYTNVLDPDLFAAIGCNWGCPSGTTFRVPKLDGMFLRGKDAGSGKDPDAGSRIAQNGGATGDNVGSVQSDAFQNITGQFSGAYYSSNVAGAFAANGAAVAQQDSGSSARPIITFDASRVARTSTETRPVNAYVKYCIVRFN